MNRKTRKHIWPVALMSLAVFGVVAAFVALSAIQPQAAQADGCDQISDPIARAQCDARHRSANLDPADSTHSHEPEPMDGNGGGMATCRPATQASVQQHQRQRHRGAQADHHPG